MFLYSLGWHLVLCSLLVSELNHQNKNQHKMLCCDKQDVQDTPTKSGTPAKEGARPFKGLGRDTFTALQVMLVERGLMTTRFFCYFPFLLPLQSKLTTMWSTLASIWPWTGAMFLHLFSVLLKFQMMKWGSFVQSLLCLSVRVLLSTCQHCFFSFWAQRTAILHWLGFLFWRY